MLTAKEVRTALGFGCADTVGKGKDGIIVRKGYFYRHGMDAETFKARVMVRLLAEGLEPEFVRCGDVWKPFRGGASIAQGSHFYVVVK